MSGKSTALKLPDQQRTRFALSALLVGVLALMVLALGGCSSQILDLRSDEAQPSPKEEAGTYLPVNDVPPHDGPAISPEQRAKIEAELAAARDRQAIAAKDASAK